MTAPAPFTATYRLQLHAGFTLADARALVPYLEALGVSHAYTSPVLAARPGSQHGYDVIDPSRLNPELGDQKTLGSFAEALHSRKMGWLLDIVPNHMAASPFNGYWDDVLRLGARSPYAHWFDIAWNAPAPLYGRVMLPVLGDELDAVISRDELRVSHENGQYRLRYFDHSFPIDPSTLSNLLDAAGSDAEAQDPARVMEAFSAGDAGPGRLRALVDAQPYLLSFWRRAATQINYRRFFEINDLVAVRQEDPGVFDATHALILEWVEKGLLDGVRVDHVDGLFDPAGYLHRLRGSLDERAAARGAHPPIYVEKILEHDERLRDDWPVAGTTGYEVLNDIEAVLIDARGSERVEHIYRELLGLGERGPRFRDVARHAKQYMLRHSFDADIRRVARLMAPVLRRRDPHALASQRALRSVMMQLTAAFPVYRSYLTGGTVAPEDRALVERAEATAREMGIVDATLLARVTDVLLREDPSDAGDIAQLRRNAIALFQQTTSPAMAKGIEDTALYMYAPLASLNEVGGTPDRDLSKAVRRLHKGASERRAGWPTSMVCTFTHDTKRSADLRARLDVLSEIPEEWGKAVAAWQRMTRGARRKVRGRYEPDFNTEYLLYQALLGTWPHDLPDDETALSSDAREVLRERLEEYIVKAAREAKMRTSWIEPNAPFEDALRTYVATLLGDEGPFLSSVARLAKEVTRPGMWNALARIIVHLSTPGVPDIYQGGELWSFALVDPDNRRPVDYALRREFLKELQGRFDAASPDARAAYVRELLHAVEDGRLKMHLTRQLLRLRRSNPELFLEGNYAPIESAGAQSQHLIAFTRAFSGQAAIAVATRLSRTLSGGVAPPVGDIWGETRVFLPEPLTPISRWTCVVSGHSVEVARDAAAAGLRVSDVLRHLPVAVLVRAD